MLADNNYTNSTNKLTVGYSGLLSQGKNTVGRSRCAEDVVASVSI